MSAVDAMASSKTSWSTTRVVDLGELKPIDGACSGGVSTSTIGRRPTATKWALGPTFSSKDDSWSAHVMGRLQVDGDGEQISYIGGVN
jgi:hypothetical protein